MQPFVEMENFHENVQIKITYDAIQHGLSVRWDLSNGFWCLFSSSS